MNEHTQTNQLDPLLNLLFDDGLQSALPRIAAILTNAAMMVVRPEKTLQATSKTAIALRAAQMLSAALD